jgi:hypothetical protein
MAHWLADHAAARECIYAAMRRLDERSKLLYAFHRKLLPPHGSIPAGGAHMDPFFQAEAISYFLALIRSGSLPSLAAVDAIRESARTVAAWNCGKEYQIRRWEHCCDALIEDAARAIVAAAGK